MVSTAHGDLIFHFNETHSCFYSLCRLILIAFEGDPTQSSESRTMAFWNSRRYEFEISIARHKHAFIQFTDSRDERIGRINRKNVAHVLDDMSMRHECSAH